MRETSEREEDVAFALWREARSLEERELGLNRLIDLLTLHGYAVCYLQLKARRPEVVNAALGRIVAGMHKFRGESKFSTWTHRIFLNECAREAKKQAIIAEREVAIEDMTVEPVAPDAQGEEFCSDIEMARLLEGDDKAFWLLKRGGADDAEIGHAMHLSPAGVRVRWHRIRNKLRSLLSTSDVAIARGISSRGKS